MQARLIINVTIYNVPINNLQNVGKGIKPQMTCIHHLHWIAPPTKTLIGVSAFLILTPNFFCLLQVLYIPWWLNQFWSGGLGGVHMNKNASKNNKKSIKKKWFQMPSKFDDDFCLSKFEKNLSGCSKEFSRSHLLAKTRKCNAKNIWINKKKKPFVCVEIWCFLNYNCMVYINI